jgi:hypothetical protein
MEGIAWKFQPTLRKVIPMKKARLALLAAPLLALSFASPAYAAGTYEQNSYRLGCSIAWAFGLHVCAELR